MLTIVLINLFYVLALDVAGFWNEISARFKHWLTNGKMHEPFDFKPFSCSLCMTFWTSLAYILFAGWNFPLLIFALGVSVLSPVTASVILLLKNLLLKFIDTLNNYIL